MTTIFVLTLIYLLTILLVRLIFRGRSESKKIIHTLCTSFEQMDEGKVGVLILY